MTTLIQWLIFVAIFVLVTVEATPQVGYGGYRMAPRKGPVAGLPYRGSPAMSYKPQPPQYPAAYSSAVQPVVYASPAEPTAYAYPANASVYAPPAEYPVDSYPPNSTVYSVLPSSPPAQSPVNPYPENGAVYSVLPSSPPTIAYPTMNSSYAYSAANVSATPPVGYYPPASYTAYSPTGQPNGYAPIAPSYGPQVQPTGYAYPSGIGNFTAPGPSGPFAYPPTYGPYSAPEEYPTGSTGYGTYTNPNGTAIIATDTGLLRGLDPISRGGLQYFAFLGIPYAEPPVRFQVWGSKRTIYTYA